MSTAEFFDREYNARASIANATEILSGWRKSADLAREVLPGLKEVSFGTSSGESLDLFWCLKPDRPLFVFIHGGYWRSLHKDDFSWIAAPYLARGVNVAVLNYDLIPKVSMQALVRQIFTAIAWLFDHAEELDFDPGKIFVGGHSAGGHLSAMMLCTQWPRIKSSLPANLVKGALAVSGLFDLDPISKSPYLNNDLNLSSEDVRELSPVAMPPSHSAPLLLAVGSLESSEFHRQSDLLEQAWQGKLPITRINVPERNHLTVCDALCEPGHPLFERWVSMMAK